MKISKTRFINGINCPRFFALFELYKKKEQAIVSFTDDLSDLMSEENLENKRGLLHAMYEITGEEGSFDVEYQDLIKQEDKQLQVMYPYYLEIEKLGIRKAKTLFGEDIISSANTYQQKRFKAEYKEYEFYCFLDGYQEGKTLSRIIEVKGTTSRKFIPALSYKDDGLEYDFFVQSPDGIYKTREALNLETHPKYFTRKNKILNRMDSVGCYIYDLCYQRFVVEHSKEPNKEFKYYLAVLNHDYVYDGKKDDQGNPIYDDDIIRIFDVTDLTLSMMPQFIADADEVVYRLDHMFIDKDHQLQLCPPKGRFKCMFHDICYDHIPKTDSVFTYINRSFGFKDQSGVKHSVEDLIRMKMLKVTDVPFEWLERKINIIQYNAVKDNEEFIKEDEIKLILSKLTYPLYHLDFESFPCPLPRFVGERCYTQSLFQFNLHIEKEPGKCDRDKDSYYFLATDHTDQRLMLVEKLISLIKNDQGNIIAYNDAFERTRLKELAVIFPQHQKYLNNIIDRTFDLMYVIKGGNHRLYEKWGIPKIEGCNYYHPALQGSFSIKKVLPIFAPDLSYKLLESVQNGTDALVTYALYPTFNQKEFDHYYNSLVEYCKLDTYAMVEILNALRKRVK